MDQERIAIIGLGNPGEKYEKTRHNIGFRVIDALAKSNELSPVDSSLDLKKDNNLKAEVAESHYKQLAVILAKPTTFVNNSGEAVKKIKDRYNLKNKEVWVICDDLDLTIGRIRARAQGSSGGHNGLKDVIDKIGSDFARIKVGIKPVDDFAESSKELKNDLNAKRFVLDRFNSKEKGILKTVLDKTQEHILASLKEKCLVKTTIEIE